jgi:hypothetical protein
MIILLQSLPPKQFLAEQITSLSSLRTSPQSLHPVVSFASNYPSAVVSVAGFVNGS